MQDSLDGGREAPLSTKARILAVAENVFAQSGFAGASTREIATGAGVNISSLHYHWESKEKLYFAVFENVYGQILDVVRDVIPATIDPEQGRAVMETSMGALFDFFADRPNIPKLLVRRLLENDEGPAAIEAEVLVPAWNLFAEWMRSRGGAVLNDLDSPLFMLTIYNVVLLYLLDSRHYASLLGGSVQDPAVRERIRRYVVDLVPLLLGRGMPAGR